MGKVVSTSHLIGQSASSVGATVGAGDEGGNKQTEELGESVDIFKKQELMRRTAQGGLVLHR